MHRSPTGYRRKFSVLFGCTVALFKAPGETRPIIFVVVLNFKQVSRRKLASIKQVMWCVQRTVSIIDTVRVQ